MNKDSPQQYLLQLTAQYMQLAYMPVNEQTLQNKSLQPTEHSDIPPQSPKHKLCIDAEYNEKKQKTSSPMVLPSTNGASTLDPTMNLCRSIHSFPAL
jgi:hypothetical protein